MSPGVGALHRIVGMPGFVDLITDSGTGFGQQSGRPAWKPETRNWNPPTSTKDAVASPPAPSSIERNSMASRSVPEVRNKEPLRVRFVGEETASSPAMSPRVSVKRKREEEQTLLQPGSPGRASSSKVNSRPSSPAVPPDSSSQTRSASPVSRKTLRTIDRLTGCKEPSLPLSASGTRTGAGGSGDPFSLLNVNWLMDEAPSITESVLEARRQERAQADAKAFFHYPGAADDEAQREQWVNEHPLHALFNKVYPVGAMASALAPQGVLTPMHMVIRGGIADPVSFYRSLSAIHVQADDHGLRPDTLLASAKEVCAKAKGLLRDQAAFCQRLFAAVLELKKAGDDTEAGRAIAESLRQEWLKTDFNELLGRQPVVLRTSADTAMLMPDTPSTPTAAGKPVSESTPEGTQHKRKKQKTSHRCQESSGKGQVASRLALLSPLPKINLGGHARQPSGEELLGDPDFPWGSPAPISPTARDALSRATESKGQSEIPGLPAPVPVPVPVRPSTDNDDARPSSLRELASEDDGDAQVRRPANYVCLSGPKRQRKLREKEFRQRLESARVIAPAISSPRLESVGLAEESDDSSEA